MTRAAPAFVYLVITPKREVVAVLEDDADYAARVAENNRGFGWTVERRTISRAVLVGGAA